MILDEDYIERSVRRLRSCKYTLHAIIDDLEDPGDPESRADILLAVEDLHEVLQFLLEATRNIAWEFAPINNNDSEDLE